jgi:hypothetical protein
MIYLVHTEIISRLFVEDGCIVVRRDYHRAFISRWFVEDGCVVVRRDFHRQRN